MVRMARRLGQTLTLVIRVRAAGIKNPTEEKNYKVGAQILPLIDQYTAQQRPQRRLGSHAVGTGEGNSVATTTTSAAYELSVVGKGFNNGTGPLTRTVYTGGSISEWWDLLDCKRKWLRADDHRFRFQRRDHRLRLCAEGGEKIAPRPTAPR